MNKRSALLVIDVQKIYSLEDSELKVQGVEEVISNINKIIAFYQNKDLPIIYVRHIHAPDGSDAGRMFDFTGQQEELGFVRGAEETRYIESLLKIENAREVIKTRYSAFVGTDLAKLLTDMGIDRVAIVGFMTNFCCESTARDAHDRDYYVDFILDATGTPDLEDLSQEGIKLAVSETLSSGFAKVSNTEEFLKG